jgi:hypothetical protein
MQLNKLIVRSSLLLLKLLLTPSALNIPSSCSTSPIPPSACPNLRYSVTTPAKATQVNRSRLDELSLPDWICQEERMLVTVSRNIEKVCYSLQPKDDRKYIQHATWCYMITLQTGRNVWTDKQEPYCSPSYHAAAHLSSNTHWNIT